MNFTSRCRPCGELSTSRCHPCGALSDDEEVPLLPGRRGAEEESSDGEEEVDHPMPKRSGREKRFPDRYGL